MKKKKARQLLMSSDHYADIKGSVCPVCGSSSIEGGSFDVAGHRCSQEVSCLDCDSEWIDEYQLTGYSLVRRGDV